MSEEWHLGETAYDHKGRCVLVLGDADRDRVDAWVVSEANLKWVEKRGLTRVQTEESTKLSLARHFMLSQQGSEELRTRVREHFHLGDDGHV